MLTLIRVLFRIHKPLVTKEDALKIVIEHCSSRGISIKDPNIHERLTEWMVRIDGTLLNSRFFVVDNQSGKIIRDSQGPR